MSDNLTPEQLNTWDMAYDVKNDAFRMSNRCAHLWSASWRGCGIETNCLKTSQRRVAWSVMTYSISSVVDTGLGTSLSPTMMRIGCGPLGVPSPITILI